MSTTKTSMGLNQWTASDKPLMAEFNSDNKIIDGKLQELSKNKVDFSSGWKTATVAPVNGVSFDGGKFEYFIQGNILIVSGTIGINPGLKQFVKVADITIPDHMTRSCGLYCTGNLRGTSADYQDQQHVFRLTSTSSKTFELVATRPITGNFQEPTSQYSYHISGFGVIYL